MDMNKANKFRIIFRVVGCLFALVAAITAFIFRRMTDDPFTMVKVCKVARFCSIALFVAAVGLVVFDVVAKAFSPKAAMIALVLALIGFIGNFIVSPASSEVSFAVYLFDLMAKGAKNATQIDIGSYMILASGVFYISFSFNCMKRGQ